MITVGILGNGQLGQMLASSVADLTDIEVRLYDLRAHSEAALIDFMQQVDVISYETENINSAVVELMEPFAEKVFPAMAALKTFQNRLLEKQALRDAGIDTADFHAVNSQADLEQAAQQLGYPIFLKTTTEGYDGKGQFVLKSDADIATAWSTLGPRELIAEAFVPFARETSIIASRDKKGEVVVFPMTENIHHEGILRCSLFPAHGICQQKTDEAESYIRQLSASLDYVGTITLELFDTGEHLVANEVAPRVHNSGHWSIEGAATSQFRNHMLAITGRPLGDTASKYPAVAMLNVIGEEIPAEGLEKAEGVMRHSYNKEARPARKLGHVTIVADSIEQRDSRIEGCAVIVPDAIWPISE